MFGANLLATVLWALVGAFCGAVASPLLGQLPRSTSWAIVGAIVGGAISFRHELRGRLGVPIVCLAAAIGGWLIGFWTNVWQVGALAVLAGTALGVVGGLRLQDKFSRNTSRGPGSGGFYSG